MIPPCRDQQPPPPRHPHGHVGWPIALVSARAVDVIALTTRRLVPEVIPTGGSSEILATTVDRLLSRWRGRRGRGGSSLG
jgi:hypothetical protein